MLTNEEFTILAEKYTDTVFRVAFNCLGSREDAEDAAQEVFLKLLRETKPFASEEHVRSWLIRVTVNHCRNILRTHWWRAESLQTEAVPAQPEDAQRDELLSMVMALPRKYRVPIYLYYYEGYSTQEIGELIGKPKNTVCTLLSRGRKLLQKTAKEEYDFV